MSLEDQNEQIERTKRFIKGRFSNADFGILGPIRYFSKKPLELVVKGPKTGETPTFLKGGSDFQQSFLNLKYVKNALGDTADSVIAQTSEDIRKKKKSWINSVRIKLAILYKKRPKKKKN